MVLAARWLARLQLRLASALLGGDLQPFPPSRPAGGLLGWVRAALGDPASWRAVAYLVLRAPLAVAGTYLAVALWVYYGLLDLLVPLQVLYHQGQAGLRPFLLRAPDNAVMLTVRTVPGTWALLAIGITSLLAAPWAVRAVAAADRLLARAVFAPGPAGCPGGSASWNRPGRGPSTTRPRPCAGSSGTCMTGRRSGSPRSR